MITIDEAAKHIDAKVVYRAPHVKPDEPGEEGVIVKVTESAVFVRYGADTGAKATPPELLDLVAKPKADNDTQPENRVFHVDLDLSLDYPNSYEATVIIGALEEYASTRRWEADGDTTPHGDYFRKLADTADDLRERIDAQMGDANVRIRT